MLSTKINAGHGAACEVVRGNKIVSPAVDGLAYDLITALRGTIGFEHFRGGRRINNIVTHNAITIEGKNRLLDVMFGGGTQVDPWYMGLIDSTNYTAAPVETDTYALINGGAPITWQEFSDYTDANNASSTTTRPEWQTDAASSKAITNSTVAIYDITVASPTTVKGVFTVGGSAGSQLKNDPGGVGVLWATALFSGADVQIASGDQLKITYTVSA